MKRGFCINLVVMGIVFVALASIAGAQDPDPQTQTGALAALGTAFTYQGELRTASGLVSGTCDFQFGLWDAQASGAQVGSPQTVNGVSVANGRFAAQLDFGSTAFAGDERFLQIAVRCPAGNGSYTTLAPRQRLTAAPYALSLRPGAMINGTGASSALTLRNDSGDGLRVYSAGNEGVYVGSAIGGVYVHSSTIGAQVYSATYGVYVNSARYTGVRVDSAGGEGVQVLSAGGAGVHVRSANEFGVDVESARTGLRVYSATNGLWVDSASTGVNVYSATAGLKIDRARHDGVSIGSAGDSGIDVGSATNGLRVDSATNGVWVDSASTGVYVYSATTGLKVDRARSDGVSVGSAGNIGVDVGSAPTGLRVDSATTGLSVNSASGNGVHVSSAITGVHVYSATSGLIVDSANRNGVRVERAGVAGVSVAEAGTAGMWVSQAGEYGVGVYKAGNPSSLSMSTFPSGFEMEGSEGYGLYVGRADMDGVYVFSAGGDGVNVRQAGGDGMDATSTNASAYGGRFVNSATGGVGLYARGGSNTAPDLILGGNSSTSDNGLIRSDTTFTSSDILLTSNDAIQINLDANNDESGNLWVVNGTGTTVFAINENGDMTAIGTKNALVTTQDYGQRQLYAMESPQNWFEDFGSAQLENGQATVPIEPVFAQTVNLTETYHVFLTPLGDCPLYVSGKTQTSFSVKAMGGQACSIAFDYRIVAKRLGYEHLRLEAAATGGSTP